METFNVLNFMFLYVCLSYKGYVKLFYPLSVKKKNLVLKPLLYETNETF